MYLHKEEVRSLGYGFLGLILLEFIYTCAREMLGV
jgi:hypothetical protein